MKIVNNIIISMRPEQWTKNLIVFAGLFFGRQLTSLSAFAVTLQIFFIFSIISSGSYIINDIVDRKEDGCHPEKSKRPIASGKLKISTAFVAATLLILAGFFWAHYISFKLLALTAAFFILHIIYDLVLKHFSIMDTLAISFAFILRLMGGVVLSPVENKISTWILLCTLLLALFLALCKRRAEIAVLLNNSKSHRKSLAGYSTQFLDQLITIAGGCTILSYSLYALSPETIAKHGTDKLAYTIPFVIYGIFRYLYLVHKKEGGSNPEKLLLKDKPLLFDIALYCFIVYMVVYQYW